MRRHTIPYVEAKNSTVNSTRSDDVEDLRRPALLREEPGLDDEAAVALIVNGFVKESSSSSPWSSRWSAKTDRSEP